MFKVYGSKWVWGSRTIGTSRQDRHVSPSRPWSHFQILPKNPQPPSPSPPSGRLSPPAWVSWPNCRLPLANWIPTCFFFFSHFFESCKSYDPYSLWGRGRPLGLERRIAESNKYLSLEAQETGGISFWLLPAPVTYFFLSLFNLFYQTRKGHEFSVSLYFGEKHTKSGSERKMKRRENLREGDYHRW